MSGHDSIVGSDRVQFYRGDQGNRDDLDSMYSSFGNKKFDFILEDGSHTEEHQMISLGHLFQYVKSGGIYILEDASIPGHKACCIRNDQTYITLSNFIQTQKFVTEYITDDEKKYLEDNIDKIELYPDVQDAYATAIIYKK
jgi:cephalosporin hydroxylase